MSARAGRAVRAAMRPDTPEQIRWRLADNQARAELIAEHERRLAEAAKTCRAAAVLAEAERFTAALDRRRAEILNRGTR